VYLLWSLIGAPILGLLSTVLAAVNGIVPFLSPLFSAIVSGVMQTAASVAGYYNGSGPAASTSDQDDTAANTYKGTMIRWFVGLLILTLYVAFEAIRWHRIKASLRRNRLVYAEEFSDFEASLESMNDVQVLQYLCPALTNSAPSPSPGTAAGSNNGGLFQRIDGFTQTATNIPVHVAHQLLQQQGDLLNAISQDVSATLSFGKSEAEITAKDQERIKEMAERITSKIRQQLAPVASASKLDMMVPQQGEIEQVPAKFDILNNLTFEPQVMWTPAILDVIGVTYSWWTQRRLLNAGFKQVCSTPIELYRREPLDKPRSGSKQKPPILFLHGIGGSITWLPDMSTEIRDRVLLYPRHSGLKYELRWDYKRGEIMTSLQYVRHICDQLSAMGVYELDLVAWSYGGLVRSYLHREFVTLQRGAPPGVKKRQSFRREVLVEPIGLPISNALGSTYSLMPFSQAWERAKKVAPKGNRFHHALVLLYLRMHMNIRPLYTDAFHSIHSFAFNSWNHHGMLVELSDDDIVTDTEATINYLRKMCPKASFDRERGPHGTFPVRWSRLTRRMINHLNTD